MSDYPVVSEQYCAEQRLAVMTALKLSMEMQAAELRFQLKQAIADCQRLAAENERLRQELIAERVLTAKLTEEIEGGDGADMDMDTDGLILAGEDSHA